jgi:hypothetical protein
VEVSRPVCNFLKCPSGFGSSHRIRTEEGIKLATERLRETPEERPAAEPAAVPPRRRLLRDQGAKGTRSLIFLLVALTVEFAWLVTLGYALYHFLA